MNVLREGSRWRTMILRSVEPATCAATTKSTSRVLISLPRTTRASAVQPMIDRMMVMPKYTRSGGHTWSAEDTEHVALCAEFPSLSWLAPTPQEALAGMQELVRQIVADMRSNNETPPESLAERTYSGRFVVRVPPKTHRELAIEAAEEGVSLNRLVSARLAR